MRDVAISGFAQLPTVRQDVDREEAEQVQPVVNEALASAGVTWDDVGFVVSGSSDYLCGRPFSFVAAVDGLRAWPPIAESHVEMDGAFALYEAWVRLQHGDVDVALVYAFGKSSLGPLPHVLGLQLDPYYEGPLGLDSISLAALGARAMLDSGVTSLRAMAEIAVARRAAGKSNPNAQVTGDFDVDALLSEPAIASPLRKHDCAPIGDGAAAVVLVAGDRAKSLKNEPAWIRAIDHRVDAMGLGRRRLDEAPSASLAAEKVGVSRGVDVAEIHAPFTHQDALLQKALGLPKGTTICPSGGALAANPVMVAGLLRFGEAAARIWDGSAGRALAHATSGPCLQQNLVAILEGGA